MGLDKSESGLKLEEVPIIVGNSEPPPVAGVLYLIRNSKAPQLPGVSISLGILAASLAIKFPLL